MVARVRQRVHRKIGGRTDSCIKRRDKPFYISFRNTPEIRVIAFVTADEEGLCCARNPDLPSDAYPDQFGETTEKCSR
eukprot:COSAG02_NODE_45353_length_358_cov_0.590734_1_plen_77_part_01